MSKAPAIYPKLVDEPKAAPPPEQPTAPARDGELLTDVAHSVLVYMSPDGHKALARMAVEESRLHSKVKVHDLILLAMQEFGDRRGLSVTFRAKPKPGKGRGQVSEGREGVAAPSGKER
jgi:hypothetical protein